VVVVGNTYVWLVPLPPGSVNWFDPPSVVVCDGVVYVFSGAAEVGEKVQLRMLWVSVPAPVAPVKPT
jgi:hypothetical protein